MKTAIQNPDRLVSEEIRRSLAYDPETGVVSWLRPNGAKQAAHRRFPGDEAGSIKLHGYRAICICGLDLLAHRVAWFLHHGEWPATPIDHADGDGLNNRLANLRTATVSQNSCNRQVMSTNASGFKGVWASGRRWAAEITVSGKRTYLGSFATPEAAAEAYASAARELHGEFHRRAENAR